jgi:branched-chain amino acid transport system ATP-binding protein
MKAIETPLLQARGLCAGYARVEAVRQVNLQILPGQIVTIVGANGAGKTTLLSALMGLLPSTGERIYCGRSLSVNDDVESLVASGMALVPETRELFAQMSIEDNLRLGAYDRWRRGARDQDDDIDEVYRLFPRLHERRAQTAGTLSGGERQMLAMGRALMARPKLLMLDEPSLGLAPLIIRDVFRIIAGLRARGISVLLVEQNARAALQVADYGYVMETGSVSLHGPAEALLHDPRVIDSYLGRAPKASCPASHGAAGLPAVV